MTVLVCWNARSCGPDAGPQLWNHYSPSFMDGQIRVIARDSGDRTTSEGQAYAMFFTLVANDRSRFDKLLRWTELNLAEGSLAERLPAWLWGRSSEGDWRVLDSNSASDADVWIAYSLFEAGAAWSEPRYTRLAERLSTRIADEEVVEIPRFGRMLLPAPRGFHDNGKYRLNVSYLPLQVFVALSEWHRDGPWMQIAVQIPSLVRATSPHGFATDWIDVSEDGTVTPSSHGSYDAIRVYLWVGMLDPEMPARSDMLQAIPGMARIVSATHAPPAKVTAAGVVDDPRGPVGFSAALVPYLDALGDGRLARDQWSRARSSIDANTGLLGRPAKYYDQNLALFALGAREGLFWFDARGRLRTKWMAQ